MFLRRWRIPQPYRAWIDDLMAEQKGQGYRWYAFDNKESAASRRILEASQEEQRGFVLAAAEWLNLYHGKQSAALRDLGSPSNHADRAETQAPFRPRRRLSPPGLVHPPALYARARNTTDDQGAQGSPEGARAHPRSPQTGHQTH